MKKEKKPDNVVFNEEDNSYDASIKPYATNVSAPAIVTTDTTTWKNVNIDKVNKQVKARYDELKNELEDLMEKFEYNNLIYQSKFSFEPVIGETYHLYKRENEESFLSLIAPHECKFEHLGTFRLNADKMWEKLEM